MPIDKPRAVPSSSSTRAESGLAACAAESAGKVGGLAALQQYHDDEHKAVHYEERGQEPSGETEAKDDDGYADQ